MKLDLVADNFVVTFSEMTLSNIHSTITITVNLMFVLE